MQRCIECGCFNENCSCVLCNCCLEYSNSYFICLQCNEEVCLRCESNHHICKSCIQFNCSHCKQYTQFKCSLCNLHYCKSCLDDTSVCLLCEVKRRIQSTIETTFDPHIVHFVSNKCMSHNHILLTLLYIITNFYKQ
jgi:hypothetical protein